jgi:hypothetical protein
VPIEKEVSMTTPNLADSLDKDYADAWRHEVSDKIIGEVVDLSEREGKFGVYPIVTLRQDDGTELAVHAFHDVLANELGRIAPSPGDVIGIRYMGKHPEKGYHQYRVRRAGGSSSVNWAKYGPQSGPSVSGPDSELQSVAEPADDFPY